MLYKVQNVYIFCIIPKKRRKKTDDQKMVILLNLYLMMLSLDGFR